MAFTPKSSRRPWWLAPWFVPVVCGGIVVVGVVGWLVVGALQPEPKYDGKPLSYWIAQTKDASPTVRGGAAKPLSYMAAESTRAKQTLIALLQDKDVNVRIDAADSLVSIGPAAKEAVPALIKMIQSKDKYANKVAAIRALGSMGPEARSAVPALMELLREDDFYDQKYAAKALKKIKPEARSAK